MALGLSGAYVLTKYLESLTSMLYGVKPRDPLTFGVIAIAIGIPLGVVGGRTAWALAASQLGVVNRVTMPLLTATAGCAALLVVSLLLALVPAHMARRVSVATALRRD